MRYIAFDLETTGFLPGVEQITEIGAVKFENGKPIGRFATLVNPQKSIPAEVIKITGITDDMVKDMPLIEELLPSFAEFCGDDMIIAHNAAFDVQFLTADIKKYESVAPRGIVLDTLAMAKKIMPGLANYKLGTLVQLFEISSTDFHRAEEDASYCGQLFWKLVGKIADNNQIPAIENLIQLSGGKTLEFPQIERQPKQLGLGGLL
ncbi:MAG: PolC-type DNA polymerase III [Bdellovibrionales bacterium]